MPTSRESETTAKSHEKGKKSIKTTSQRKYKTTLTTKIKRFSTAIFMRFSIAIFSVLFTIVKSAPTAQQGSMNPFSGTVGYLNPDYKQQVQQSIQRNSSIKEAASLVYQQPTFIWISATEQVNSRAAKNVPLAMQQATKDRPMYLPFVIYNLPGRDCSAGASDGEYKVGELNRYKAEYIDRLATIFRSNTNPNLRIILAIEPDSLPNLITGITSIKKCKDAADGYKEGIAYAIATFSAIPNVYLYIDAGNGGWLGPKTAQYAELAADIMDKSLKLNPQSTISGFATGISNFEPFDAHGVSPATVDCPSPVQECQGNPAVDAKSYTNLLSQSLSAKQLPARFIVDTSRNGRAGIRQFTGQWCNLKGAGFGHIPVADPAPTIDAFGWIKTPGESDGASSKSSHGYSPTCDPEVFPAAVWPNAPEAGKWFHDQFQGLILNSEPSILGGYAPQEIMRNMIIQ